VQDRGDERIFTGAGEIRPAERLAGPGQRLAAGRLTPTSCKGRGPVASMSDSEHSDRAARSTSRGVWHECPTLRHSPVRPADRPS
jgi:hypothetical protein